jgi:hypothetical protein
MTLVNEKVEHINFGLGVITDENDHKIWVQFQEDIGEKIFQYPEAFEKFLKAANSAVENNVLEELHRKQEQIELERKEKERAAAELKEKIENLVPAKKKAASKTRSKKS